MNSDYVSSETPEEDDLDTEQPQQDQDFSRTCSGTQRPLRPIIRERDDPGSKNRPLPRLDADRRQQLPVKLTDDSCPLWNRQQDLCLLPTGHGARGYVGLRGKPTHRAQERQSRKDRRTAPSENPRTFPTNVRLCCQSDPSVRNSTNTAPSNTRTSSRDWRG